jgi:aminoglycoside phosphotransferase (APT) family kinase protein
MTGAINGPAVPDTTDDLLRHVIEEQHEHNRLLAELKLASDKALQILAVMDQAHGGQLRHAAGQLDEVLSLAREAAPLLERLPKWATRRRTLPQAKPGD